MAVSGCLEYSLYPLVVSSVGLALYFVPGLPIAAALAVNRLHGEIKRLFDPKGLLNPGKKLATSGEESRIATLRARPRAEAD